MPRLLGIDVGTERSAAVVLDSTPAEPWPPRRRRTSRLPADDGLSEWDAERAINLALAVAAEAVEQAAGGGVQRNRRDRPDARCGAGGEDPRRSAVHRMAGSTRNRPLGGYSSAVAGIGRGLANAKASGGSRFCHRLPWNHPLHAQARGQSPNPRRDRLLSPGLSRRSPVRSAAGHRPDERCQFRRLRRMARRWARTCWNCWTCRPRCPGGTADLHGRPRDGRGRGKGAWSGAWDTGAQRPGRQPGELLWQRGQSAQRHSDQRRDGRTDRRPRRPSCRRASWKRDPSSAT